MALINYGGYTFSTTSSGALQIDGGWSSGPIVLTDIDAVVPQSFSSAASSPRVPAGEKDRLIALGNDYQTIIKQMKAANKAEYEAANPLPPQSTAATEVTSSSPASVGTSSLTPQEEVNIKSSNTKNDSTSDNVVSKASEVTAAGTDYTIAPNFNTKGIVQTVPGGGGYSSTNPDSTKSKPVPLMNPLHRYPSYTYNLSLALMTIEEFNEVVRSQAYTPKRVIIASAGRYNNTKDPSDPTAFVRAPFFSEDFYFDNLNINTVIGLNEHSRATNAIKLAMNIIEPYGMTLVDRIIALCSSSEVKARNYIEQPYMLQIDFFAIDDAGVIIGPLPDQVKRIPIRLLSMNIKASAKGAEYHIEACPYNHSAYDISTLATPGHFEIVAGSVASFFQSTESETGLVNALQQRETVSKSGVNAQGQKYFNGEQQYVPLTAVGNASSTAVSQLSADPIYKVKSYGSAYNAWQSDLQKRNKIKYADKIFFKFAPELQNAKFILGKNMSHKDVPMAGPDNEISMRAGNVPGTVNAALDYSTQIFSINAGTSIEMVINYVIRNSNYIQDQLVVAEDFGSDIEAYKTARLKNKDLPLRWFKIVPQVIIPPDGYDTVRKVWAREITYNVVTYDVWNTKISAAPQGTWTNPYKEYNYYYTGKNLDIIEFNIEFNALYYTAVTAYKRNMAATYGLSIYDDRELNPENYVGIDDAPNAVQPMKEKPIVQDGKARATGGEITPRAAAAVDTQESLYTTAGGDMLQGQLKIIGDPQYIKQDDSFWPPANLVDPATGAVSKSPPSTDDRLIANGSLHMDKQELYIQVTFNTPSDIDESTGLMKTDTSFQKSSMFSGMFRVLTVDSVFSGGKFEQTLNIVRLPRQTALNYTAEKQTTQRSESGTASGSSTATTAPPTTTSSKTASVSDVVAPGSAPVKDEATPVTTTEQAKLAQVNETAPTQVISDSTESQAITEGSDLTAKYQQELMRAFQQASSASDAYVAAIQSGASQADKDRLQAASQAASKQLGEISKRNQQYAASQGS